MEIIHKYMKIDSTYTNFGEFNFILSRNMLIYFDKKSKIKTKMILDPSKKEIIF